MCLKLIDKSLLDQAQKDWINTYHDQCRKRLIPECQRQGWSDLIPWIKLNTEML